MAELRRSPRAILPRPELTNISHMGLYRQRAPRSARVPVSVSVYNSYKLARVLSAEYSRVESNYANEGEA